MELIDKAALLKDVENFCGDYFCHDEDSFDKNAVRMAFKLAPVIDAVEVVRCCDCKYSVVPYKDSDDNVPYLYCYHPNLDEDALSPKVDFTDFCSYGRRE